MGGSLSLAAIFLASGHSKRFGGNKLLEPYQGRPLAEAILNRHPAELFLQTIVVTRYAQIALSAAERGFTVVENDDLTDDIAVTIRKGLERICPAVDGCMFSVCDQPLLLPATVRRLTQAFLEDPASIHALGYKGRRGNPVIFPRAYFRELSALPAGSGGSAVIAAHRQLLRLTEAGGPEELLDLDSRDDWEKLKK